jgi:diacylglycerol kinase
LNELSPLQQLRLLLRVFSPTATFGVEPRYFWQCALLALKLLLLALKLPFHCQRCSALLLALKLTFGVEIVTSGVESATSGVASGVEINLWR